ncbi:MAG: hypothetical protein DI544_12565 [Sphingomonas taxi]|uniref:Uncharacterized protein n=1 Tax=Sphingomonas taxi TaxID=1549858 RepID=A0A2W5R6L1_9SPHN|nr:MAG: hypothetical protein DI544_12565 [Sphingomonas taxi]
MSAGDPGLAYIRRGGRDRHDNLIEEVYQRKDGEYAIYRTRERVLVQFADDPALAVEQRRAMAPLLPLRDEIDGLIQDWRRPREPDARSHGFFGLRDPQRLEAKAECQDRRIGGALAQALEDDTPGARLWLEKIKLDMIDERTASARFEYLLTAFVASLVVMFVAWLLASLLPLRADPPLQIAPRIAAGSVALAAGLVLSVAVGAGLVATDRWQPSPRQGILAALAAIPLVSLICWYIVQRFVPAGSLALSRPTAIGMIAILMALAIGLVIATVRKPPSSGRTLALFAVAAIPLFAMLIWPQTASMVVRPDYAVAIDIWRGFAAGAVGAFFSIALAIKSRAVLTDLLPTTNIMDAALRIVIGAIGGAVLIALIVGEVVRFELVPQTSVLFAIIAGFFAGFSERLVPDLLAKSGEKPAVFDAQLAAIGAQRAAQSAAPRPATGKPAGLAPSPAMPGANDNVRDDDQEVGPNGFQMEDDELTQDDELPPATGGRARA